MLQALGSRPLLPVPGLMLGGNTWDLVGCIKHVIKNTFYLVLFSFSFCGEWFLASELVTNHSLLMVASHGDTSPKDPLGSFLHQLLCV